MEFFETMDPLLTTFWYIAIPVSVIFLIQTVMTFMGVDSADGTSADFDGELSGAEVPFQLFSLRNLINFLLGFSWTGISFYSTISSPVLLVIVALAVGCAFVYAFFLIINQLKKLAEDNSFNIHNTLGKTAEVYLNIPGNKKGAGKVMVSVKGAFHELSAMTDHDSIPTGTVVKVVRIENNSHLIVETL